MNKYTLRALRQDPHRIEFVWLATFGRAMPANYDSTLAFELITGRIGVGGWNDLARMADKVKDKSPSVRTYRAMSHYAVML